MRRERPDHSLQPTALVHEAYVRLFKGHDQDAIRRTHFFRLSARAMREVLVEHARARGRLKRGAENKPATLIENMASLPVQDETVLQLNDALAELEKVAPRATQIVEMRFFAGMTEEEIAEASGISGSTVKREWTFARAWLNARLGTNLQK
jgi:RNA polymerase sigma factor (TIGR02999 family)